MTFGRRLVHGLLAGLLLSGAAVAAEPSSADWRPLFDGRSLGDWKPTPFGSEGEVSVVEGAIRIAMGFDLSGITFAGEIPRQHYEIALEARRVEGHDFFCGLTFPVGDDPCSLILGGWGGGVVGLSSIDGEDAAHDIRELRGLLEAFNAAKHTAWQTVVRLVTTGFLLALVAGAAIKLKVFGGGQ